MKLDIKKNREEYIFRINRAIDYIEKNLTEELTLEELAGVAFFSPFHFHRLFGALVGETLYKFILRVRLEKAAAQLIYNQKKSITDIAFECGFMGSDTFARSFKRFFKISATEYRRSKKAVQRDIPDNTDNRNTRKFDISKFYVDTKSGNLKQKFNEQDSDLIKIKIENLPDLHVAYIRHIGPYVGDSEMFIGLFNRLTAWAGPLGLFSRPGVKILSVYHDNYRITEEGRSRVSACITAPKNIEAEGEIGKMLIPGGKFAVARFELSPPEYKNAWNLLYGEWLPESGYQPDDRPSYEHFLNESKETGRHIVDICLPIKKL